MSSLRWYIALAAVLCGLTTSGSAAADSTQPASLLQALRGGATAALDNDEFGQPADDSPAPSAADVPAEPQPIPSLDSDLTAGGDCGCDGGDGCGAGCDDCCGDDDPWRLFGAGSLKDSGIDVVGWVASGATLNTQSPGDNYNGPQTFNDRDDIMLNQLYMYVGREADTSCGGLAVGGRVDLLYGTDHRFTMARGLEIGRDFATNKWNPEPGLGGDGRFYGLALPQAYAEVAYNDVSVKLGHFYTIIGYEVVTAPDNFFYSHAYTMQYGEPFTHTGLLASTKLGDSLSVSGGFHRGWDNWEDYDNQDRLDFLGGVTWTSCDEKSSVAFAITTGDEAADGAATLFRNRTMYSVVGSHQITDQLSVVVQHDLGIQDNGDGGTAGSQDAEWYGVNSYIFYELCNGLRLGTRFEWFRDDDGTRVAGLGQGNAIANGGFTGDFYGATFGCNYSPNSNVVVRPELRFDWFDGPVGQLPYDAGQSSYQTTLGVDAIIQY